MLSTGLEAAFQGGGEPIDRVAVNEQMKSDRHLRRETLDKGRADTEATASEAGSLRLLWSPRVGLSDDQEIIWG